MPTPRPVTDGFTGIEYRAVFEAAPDGIVVVDARGVIRDVNPRGYEQFGYEPGELVGQSVEVLVPEARRGPHRDQRDAYMDEPRTRPMGAGMELTGRRKDGSTFPVEISLSPMELPGERWVISVVRDLTERKRLREFGVGALRAAEDERQRIARELHDDTAQRLAAVLVRLQVATRQEDEERRAEILDEVRESVLETVEAVRRIARGLRPPILDEVGVVAAIRSHVDALGKAYDLAIEFDSGTDEPRLGADAQLALYRIVQEALSNVVRHASARRASVRIETEAGRLQVVVEDDGEGFVHDGSQPGRGLGLMGMRERARNAGGEIEIDSRPGEGTRVTVEIPIGKGGTRG